jgi:3-methyladenine DNA glycosylase AlkD
MESMAKELLHDPQIDLKLVVSTMPLLMKSGKYEETSAGLLLINRMRKQYDPSLLKQIAIWYAIGIRNWAHADMLGMWVLPALIEKKHATEKDFIPWITSEFPFQRRCVPVTYIKSLKTCSTPEGLFQIIEPLMIDPVREVHQGTGWFLREAWKLFPKQTEAFLTKYRNTGARLIFQYACEKMDKEYRLKFRREK